MPRHVLKQSLLGVCPLFLLVAVVALMAPREAAGCRMLWDHSRGLREGVNESAAFGDFVSLFGTFKIAHEITNTTLDLLDYEGVGILWLEAQHVADPYWLYDDLESQAVFQFVANGGSLLVLADSHTSMARTYLYLLSNFYIAMQQNLSANTQPVDVNATASSGVGAGVDILAASPAGAELGFVDGFVQSAVVDAQGRPLVLTAEIYPRGRVVVVWDVGVLDTNLSVADNGQLAHNILSFLTERCTDSSGCNGNCAAGQAQCFGAYCLCNPGWAGDTCNVSLLPCDFEGGCPETPMNCTESNPVQCASGACSFHPAACPEQLLSCWFGIEVACAPSGLCQNYSACYELGTSLCPAGSVVCVDGRCVSNITECDIVPPCESAYRCPGGGCVYTDLSECATPPTCEAGEQLCLDGLCRPECPLYDGCPAGYFQCEYRACVTNATLCNTCLRPPLNFTQATCWHGGCTVCGTPPSYRKPQQLRFRVPRDQDMRFPITESGFNNPLLLVSIDADTFESDVMLLVRPVALGNLREVVGEFSTTTLASIIDLKIEPPQRFLKPVRLLFVLNSLYSEEERTLEVALTFLNNQIQNWDAILQFTILTTSKFSSGLGSSGLADNPPPVGGGATDHFTSFTVLVDGTSADADSDSSSDDGRLLAIILPSVLVPLALVAIVVGAVAAFLATKWAFWRRGQRMQRLMTAVNQAQADDIAVPSTE